jgi:hypothetical protein
MRVPSFRALTGLPSAALRVSSPSSPRNRATSPYGRATAGPSPEHMHCVRLLQWSQAAPRPTAFLNDLVHMISAKGLAPAPAMRAALHAAASRLYRRCSSRPAAVRVAGAPGLPRCFRSCLSAQVPARIRVSPDARLPMEPHKMASRRHELAVIEPFNVLA